MITPYTFDSDTDINLTIDLREHAAGVAEDEDFAERLWAFRENGIDHITLQALPTQTIHGKVRRMVDDIELVELDD